MERSTKIVYCYDVHGNYTGTDFVHVDPETPGQWLYPPNCTEEKPAALPARWDGSAWQFDVDTLAAAVRAERDRLLRASDWMVLPDSPVAALTLISVKTYRQALRAVPQQPGFPAAVMWPALPAL